MGLKASAASCATNVANSHYLSTEAGLETEHTC